MAKVTLTDITSGYALTTTVNANNTLIENEFDNCLSRDGSSPNQMAANIDMNSNRITNLPTATANSEPVTLGQAASIAGVTNAFNQGTIGSTLWPQTTAESNAGVTPTFYYYEPGNAKRYGALGNGSADDTAALTTWLGCGESHLTLPAGTYLTDGNTLAETSGVGRIEGQGMPTIKRNDSLPSEVRLLQISDENELEITGIEFDGNRANQGGTATNWGDLAVIATLTAATNTVTQTDYFVTITNCIFRNSPGTCIAGAGMQNCIIQGCKFLEWDDHAVYCSGDSGTSRGLGTTVIIDSNNFYDSSGANDTCKISNNSRRYVVSNNTFEVAEHCIQITPGNANHPREVVFTGNTGTCLGVGSFSGANASTGSANAHYLFADNNMTCSTRGFYVGDTASSMFSGHLHIKGGTYKNSAGAYKPFLTNRFLDNTNSETSQILEGVSLKDFAVQEGDWPKTFVMKNCVCDATYSAWFFAIGADDSTVKHIVIEGNQFLNAPSGQGQSQFTIHDDSTLIIKDNLYNNDGIACVLKDFPQTVIFEGNTCFDVQGITIDAAATARASAGDFFITNNKMISTVGASVNVRLFDENTTTGCLLDSYNVFCKDNFFKDATQGIRTAGTAVTGYAGSNVFYSWGNSSTGSTFSNAYPAASQQSYPPGALIGDPSYTIANESTDRDFDADTAVVAETNDVLATLIKDLGYGT